MRLENLRDLCDYLGADYTEPGERCPNGWRPDGGWEPGAKPGYHPATPVEATALSARSLARRVYKDTSAGCPIDWTPPGVRQEADGGTDPVGITIDLIVRDGNIVVSRYEDWDLGHLHPCGDPVCLAPSLIEYLSLVAVGKDCSEGFWKLDLPLEDFDSLSDMDGKGHCWSQTVTRLEGGTVRVKVSHPGLPSYTQKHHAGTFTVYPYCEGSDGLDCHEGYAVTLPCDSERVGAALEAAETDSQAEWDATHGCEQCWDGQTVCDEWGNEAGPEDYGMRPVDPECKSCQGGIVI